MNEDLKFWHEACVQTLVRACMCWYVQPHTLPLVWKANNPFSPTAVGFMLPHGLDTMLEKMVIGSRGQLAWRLDIVVHTPEILQIDGGEL